MDRGELITPTDPRDCEEVRSELERILADPRFQNSKRYPAFLRYVVLQALKGNTELKERTLAIDVFGKPPSYDSNTDPVVRVTAGEVRKRLAQYYSDLEQTPEFRIWLSPGSYVPEFRRRIPSASSPVSPESEPAAAVQAAETQVVFRMATAPVTHTVHGGNPLQRHWKRLCLTCGVSMAILGLAWSARQFVVKKPTALDKLWEPIINSQGTALLCVGDAQTFVHHVLPNSTKEHPNDRVTPNDLVAREHLSAPEVIIASKLGMLLQSKGKAYSISHSSATSLSDLGQGPAILIGWFDNEWTMRLSHNLRFSIQRDDRGALIFDRQNPSRRDWTFRSWTPAGETSREYAIVARIDDPMTGRPVMIAAGIDPQASVAAGEFIITPQNLNSFPKDRPPNWERLNMEAVIQTDVIDNHISPPRLVAVHYW
jgi:hypothetical protein